MPGGLHPPSSVLEEWAKIGDPLHPTQTRGWGLAILCIVLYSLATIAVCLRLWSRFKVRQTAGIDDALIVLAMIPTAGLAISAALGSRIYGFNRHAYDLTPELAIQSRKITLVIEGTYILSTGLTKISILLFYRRMADGAISNLYRYIGGASIAFVVSYMITFLVTLFISCRPLSAFWNEVDIQWIISHKEGVDYKCVNEPADLLAASAISIVQDFLACGLPLPLFWKLQLPKRQKFALAAVFSVGFFLCITGCLRIYYIHMVFFETYDMTWAAWNAWVWTVVEAHLAIICASAPALKVFAKRYFNLSTVANGLSRSWRERSYARKGYAERSSTAHENTWATDLEGTQRDVEMKATSVTKNMEIESHDLDMVDGKESTEASLRSDEDRLSGAPERKSRISRTIPWPFMEPPAPSRGI